MTCEIDSFVSFETPHTWNRSAELFPFSDRLNVSSTQTLRKHGEQKNRFFPGFVSQKNSFSETSRCFANWHRKDL